MAETLERVYASALFELCCENDCLSEIYDEMGQVNDIFSGNEEFVKLLSSPLINDSDKHSILDKTFNGKISDLFFDFICVLSDKGRANAFSGIYDEFRNMYNDKMNILEVNVTTTEKMSDGIREKLIEKLSSVTGKSVLLDEKIDRSLLGGIIVRYDNVEIDSSVKGKLDKLKKQIDSTIA